MIVVSLIFFTYVITIGVFAFGYDKIKDFTPKELDIKTRFTVVIPFRNEAKNLPKLAASILRLNYPAAQVEFIFIDDDSTDDSVEVLKQYFEYNKEVTDLNYTQPDISIIKNERNSNSPKKDAITTALKVSTKKWIITTDADCILPENWLKTIDNFIQQNDCNLVVAPVTYITNKSFLHQFQLLDFLSLQASTVSGFGLGKPFLCNGANLAYKKEIFENVNGFENNNSIASGDDIFLLEKFLKFDNSKVAYLKSDEAIVKTFPVDTLGQLIHQRVRWASKTASYNLVFGKLIGVLILLGNGIIALSPLLVFYEIISTTTALSYFLIKLFFDYVLLEKISAFYKQKLPFSIYLSSSILYPYFTLFVVFKSLFSNYQWKGRTFKK
jgi:biofilm PGA synthesis N-glycosyltransferase PgaC